MIETILTAAVLSLLGPIAHRACDGNDEHDNTNDTSATTDSSYDSRYGDAPASGERQTTLDEFGF